MSDQANDLLNMQLVQRIQHLEEELARCKKINDDTQQRLSYFKQLYEKAPLGYQSLDENGNFVDINPAWLELFGYTYDEVIGKNFSEFLPPYWADKFHDSFKHFKERGEVSNIEYEMIKKDKSSLCVLFTGKIGKDSKGDFLQTHCIFQDITQQRLVESELRENQEKYQVMMDSMVDSVYICDENHKITYMNQAMQKSIGRNAIGEYCYKLLHQQEAPCPWCKAGIVKQGIPIEVDGFSMDSSTSYNASHSPIFHKNGEISRMTILRDTTEVKKLEANLIQAQKMESIGTLAGGIAHDFNNLLFPISGYVELLLDEIPPDSPWQETLQKVLSNTQRAQKLVKQILVFSHQSPSFYEPVKIQNILIETIKLMESTFPKTVEIQTDICSTCKNIVADEQQIQQILLNLCTNALHAMENTGGILSISLSETHISKPDESTQKPTLHNCLTITDTGTGITKEQLSRIFDPYYTTKPQGKGTGLGLSTVQAIASKCGGFVSVESSDKGSTFKVFFPVCKGIIENNKNNDNEEIKTGREQILLIDDQPDVLHIEEKILQKLGYTVTSFTNSQQALTHFKEHQDTFDLVITDLTMPELTGDIIAMEIAALKPQLPIILCTGYNDVSEEQKQKLTSIKTILQKPVSLRILSQTVRDVIDSH